jgi:hypothetical protein
MLGQASAVYADEGSSWDLLHQDYTTKRINHSECYSDGEACTNNAESLFSRMRRAEIGTHHSIAAHTHRPMLRKWLGEKICAATQTAHSIWP